MATKKAASPAAALSVPKLDEKRPSRVGKVMVGGYFEPEFSKTLRIWGMQHDLTLQQILEQALFEYAKKNKIV